MMVTLNCASPYQMQCRVRVLRLLPHVDHDPLVRRRHQLDPLLRRLLHRQLKRKRIHSLICLLSPASVGSVTLGLVNQGANLRFPAHCKEKN